MAGAAASAAPAAPALACRSPPLAARACAGARRAALCWRRGVAPAPLRARPAPARRRGVAPAPPCAKQLRSWPVAEVWEEFVLKHAGEWDSYSARFSAAGAVMELPRKYIPEAYAEWERTLHEWPGRVVSQCRKRGAPRHLTHKLERFWPTVGCEFGKDDVAEVESHTLFADCKERPFTALWADGNYCDAPATLPPGGRLRLELCLYGDADGGDLGTRTRVVFFLTGDAPAAPEAPAMWRLAGLEVFRERRTDAAEGTMRVDGFATPGASLSPVYAPVAAALAQGFWEADNGATIDRTIGTPPKMILAPYWGISPRPQWALAPRAGLLQPGQAQLVSLPEGLWAYVEQATDELLVVELGQSLANDRRRVQSVSYTRGVMDTFVGGTDALMTPEEAHEAGHTQYEDPQDQAFYEEMLETFGLEAAPPKITSSGFLDGEGQGRWLEEQIRVDEEDGRWNE